MKKIEKQANKYVDKIRGHWPWTDISGYKKDKRRKATIRAFITFAKKVRRDIDEDNDNAIL